MWQWILGAAAIYLIVKGVGAVSGNASWARALYNSVSSVLPQLSTTGRMMVVAHAAFESGWGSGWAAVNGNNIFNITTCQGSAGCADGWTGDYLDQDNGDVQYNADGSVTSISQRWRAYPSVEASVQDYWSFLGHPRYAAQGIQADLINGDPVAFINGLSAAGYFTLPADQYLTQFTAVLATVTSALT